MADSAQHILHPEIFDRLPIIGPRLRDELADRAQEVADANLGEDPDISVVIRTRNNTGRIEALFADIAAQKFAGKVQIVVVDTESNDGTIRAAKLNGAEVVNIAQADFSYPRALNLGFKAAAYPYVLSLVGHSSLSNDQTFRAITRRCREVGFGGAYGLPLSDANASWTERLAFGVRQLRYLRGAVRIIKDKPGMLGANTSVISKAAWSALGGFDETFAAGGEDSELARKMLAAHMKIVRDPVLSLHHSHGLGPVNSLRQARHWVEVYRNARGFDGQRVARRRPDLDL